MPPLLAENLTKTRRKLLGPGNQGQPLVLLGHFAWRMIAPGAVSAGSARDAGRVVPLSRRARTLQEPRTSEGRHAK